MYPNDNNCRDEDRDKSCDHLKSSSSEESVRKRRPSGNISLNSQLSTLSQTSASTDATDSAAHQQTLRSATPKTPLHHGTLTAQQHSMQVAHAVHHTPTKPIKIISSEKSTSSASGGSADSSDHIGIAAPTPAQAEVTKSIEPATPPISINQDYHYESIDTAVRGKYTYHDEPHSFENSMEFLEDYKNFQFEVLETTV